MSNLSIGHRPMYFIYLTWITFIVAPHAICKTRKNMNHFLPYPAPPRPTVSVMNAWYPESPDSRAVYHCLGLLPINFVTTSLYDVLHNLSRSATYLLFAVRACAKMRPSSTRFFFD